jgi:peptide/nickel transport system permease protein
MIEFLIRRTFWAIFLFIVATLVTYVIFFVIPADPAQLAAGKGGSSPQIVQSIRHSMGLDMPVWKQYLLFLYKLVFHGYFGKSFVNGTPVRVILQARVPITASLVFGGALFWLCLSIPVGIYSALHPRSLFDRGAVIFVLIGISAHPVWIGLILIYVFGVKLHFMPTSGYCPALSHNSGFLCSGPIQWAYHMILPWCTFMLLFAALYVRLIRATVMETMSEDYVRTARAKGAPERRVLVQHVLRNSMLPIVTILGMDIGLALGGAVFTETVFNLPGLGQGLIGAANGLDLPTVVGITVFATLCVIVFNFVVDVMYSVLDPRIRLA